MTCSHKGCPNAPAQRPVLETRSKIGRKITRVTFCQLGYCDEHRQSYALDDLLSPEGHAKLAKFMREKGLPEPDQKLTTLGWRPLDESDLEDLEDNQHHTNTRSPDDDLAF